VEGQCSHHCANPAPLKKLTNHRHFPAMLFAIHIFTLKNVLKKHWDLNNQVYLRVEKWRIFLSELLSSVLQFVTVSESFCNLICCLTFLKF